jgi:hypothetical protein
MQINSAIGYSILESEKNYITIMAAGDNIDNYSFSWACFLHASYQPYQLYVTKVSHELEIDLSFEEIQTDILHLAIEDTVRRRIILKTKKRKNNTLIFPQDYFVYMKVR